MVACCPRARTWGVRTGMPIAQAIQWCLPQPDKNGEQNRERLSGGPPKSDRHDPQTDHEVLQFVAERVQHHLTPLTSIESLEKQPWAGHPRHQCESLICDITGISHLFGGEPGVIQAASEFMSSMNLAGCFAIADHGGAAWAVAHEGTRAVAHEGTRAVAHDASSHWLIPPDPSLPPRCLIVPSGQTRGYLEPLPVRCLRIDPATLQTLGRLGIESVGQLMQLPFSGLASRLGRPLVRRLQQAIGQLDEPINVHRLETEHRETWSLQYPTADLLILMDRLQRLCEQLGTGLAARQCGALRMTCRLDLSDHSPLDFEIGFFAPTAQAEHLCGLLTQKLETIRLPSDVLRISLNVTLTGALRTTQKSLMDSQGPLFDELREGSIGGSMAGSSISRMVDSLSGRLGRAHVVEVHLQPNPLPEDSYSITPLAGENRPQRAKSKHSFGFASQRTSRFVPQKCDAMRRPLSLLQSPLTLKVSLDEGSFSQAVPSPRLPESLLLHGVVHRIVKHWGPERIETLWWKGPTIRRDYYRVETDRKHWWWIYCDLAFESHYFWMLHGRFS